jgi:hypothetical protein
MTPNAETGALMTDLEHEAMELSAQLANTLHRIIGDGPQASNDWAEAAMRIHSMQQMILAQAACRAYPDRYRLMGGTLPPIDGSGS